MKMFDLTGKVAVVTGGNGGIGLAMEEGMGGCGATVVIAARNAAKAKSALVRLEAANVKALFLSADVTRKSDCNKLVSETEAACGRLDILVNNAGIMARDHPQDFTEEAWRR